MHVIPVLDLKASQVVRAVAGERSTYQPVQSTLAVTSCPIEVARAFQEQLGFTELYLADLDALAGEPPSFGIYERLRGSGLRLQVDAGVRESQDALRLADAGVEMVILGLETLSRPETLGRISDLLGSPRTAFSLDLREGRPLGATSRWDDADPFAIGSQAVRLGAGSVIVIDLARVGSGSGIGTEELCANLAARHPQAKIIAGGGIRGLQDLLRLRETGVSAALVSSALHDGRLRSQDLAQLAGHP